jgi:hypothetical protein
MKIKIEPKQLLPIVVSILGLVIMGYGLGRQTHGGSGMLVWIGLPIVFVGLFLAVANAMSQKSKK